MALEGQELSAEQRLEQLEYALGLGDYAPRQGDDTVDPTELMQGYRREQREITARLDDDPPKAERVRLEHRLRLAIAGAHANATFQDPELELQALRTELAVAQGHVARADLPDNPQGGGDLVSNAERARRAAKRLPQIEDEILRAEDELAAAIETHEPRRSSNQGTRGGARRMGRQARDGRRRW